MPFFMEKKPLNYKNSVIKAYTTKTLHQQLASLGPPVFVFVPTHYFLLLFYLSVLVHCPGWRETSGLKPPSCSASCVCTQVRKPFFFSFFLFFPCAEDGTQGLMPAGQGLYKWSHISSPKDLFSKT
jgi:hypothetical protein